MMKDAVSERKCSKCGALMKKRIWDGEIISYELKEGRVIQDPEKGIIPDTYECEKCGHIE